MYQLVSLSTFGLLAFISMAVADKNKKMEIKYKTIVTAKWLIIPLQYIERDNMLKTTQIMSIQLPPSLGKLY